MKESDITKITTSDLYSMYLFITQDPNNTGFGRVSKDAKVLIKKKQKEIEEELYNRVYGFNPFEQHVVEKIDPNSPATDYVAVNVTPEKRTIK